MSWTKFNKYLYKYWKSQTLVIILGLVVTPLSLINPYLTKILVDKAYGEKDLGLFFKLAFVGGLVFVLVGLIRLLSGYLSQKIIRRVNIDITKDMFKCLQRVPLSFYENHSTGENIYRINNDANSVSVFVCSFLPQLITLVPRLIFVLVLVFSLNWHLALLALGLVPLTYLHPYIFGRWLRDITRKRVLWTQSVFKNLQEVFTHIHLIRAFGKEEDEIKKFDGRLKRQLALDLKNAKALEINSFSSSLLSKILSGVIAFYGGYQVIKGQLSLGGLTAIMIYLTQMLGMLKSLGGFYQKIIVSTVVCNRLSEVLNVKVQDKKNASRIFCSDSFWAVKVKDLNFSYRFQRPILENLSFSIKNGEKTALVGSSGCGKTTLFYLLLGLYNSQTGQIFLNERRSVDSNSKIRRGDIAVSLQQPFLWNETVGFNVLYGKENASYQDMVESCKLCCAGDFIKSLPEKYDTVIGERACILSEGQKQRISLARAVISNPRILLLDEALSALDSATEDRIIDNLLRKLKASTIVFISHRLSTVKKMDRVIFIDNSGKVICSTHHELLKTQIAYKNLFFSQLE